MECWQRVALFVTKAPAPPQPNTSLSPFIAFGHASAVPATSRIFKSKRGILLPLTFGSLHVLKPTSKSSRTGQALHEICHERVEVD
jgi:hypothetical protein